MAGHRAGGSAPAPQSPTTAVLLVAAYVAVLVSPLVISGLWVQRPPHSFVYGLGRSFALVGTVAICLQFILSARLRPVCSRYGLDMVLRFHGGVAVLGAVLVLLHPVLLAVGGGGLGLLISPRMPWYIVIARIALLLLAVQIATSVFRTQLRLDYEKWRLLHNQAVVILGLVFLHSWVMGSSLQVMPMRILWVGLLAASVLSYGYHKVYVPAATRRRPYTVSDIQQETHNVWTLTLEPPQGKERFDFLPGQFHFLALYRGDRYHGEEHPFTISSSPTEAGLLRSTIKESGDFTRTIGRTARGIRARVQGPFGRFSYLLHPEEKELVCIAGGVGITPIMSMLRHMRDHAAERTVLLLYANRSERDIVFRAELDAMAAGERPRLAVVHILSEADERWTGDRGLVDRPAIERHCARVLSSAAFYVCGPPPMMAFVGAALRELGVPPAHIHSERFSL